jgi:succinate dehydrogenase / fumarate reductase iron-sulfur subunit
VRLTLEIWRQKNANDGGRFVRYEMEDVDHHMSFLEMLDVLNQRLIAKGEEPVAFDSDCREGICGMCGFVINGHPHGDQPLTTVCQLHMRFFHDGQVLRLEPFRAKAFPIVRDLAIDRSALDRIVMAGGYVSVNTGGARDANSLLVPKAAADLSMDAAACIGCGACVAACPNASASLFTGAKISHLNLLPQGQPEKLSRALAMGDQHAREGFGSCTVIGECAEACPKGIKLEVIARMNRHYVAGALQYREAAASGGAG